MDIERTKAALQDLIIRLQDAEKGYKEIALATSNQPLISWLTRYSSERHEYHTVLEAQVALLGGNAVVKTSFLGDLHRMFIDVKINNTSIDGEFEAVVDEIERGSNTLIEDYSKVIKEVAMDSGLRAVLQGQRASIEKEVVDLVKLKEELLSEPS